MSRFEDLPWVDEEGYLADQGRSFLQNTDQRISRLGLPDFLTSSQKKIQELTTPVADLYSGLQDHLSDLGGGLEGAGRMAQQTSQNLTRGFTDYASDRINTLGQGLSDFQAGPTSGLPSAAQQTQDAIGGGLQDVGQQLGTDWQSLQDRMGSQLGDSLGRTGQALDDLPKAAGRVRTDWDADLERIRGERESVEQQFPTTPPSGPAGFTLPTVNETGTSQGERITSDLSRIAMEQTPGGSTFTALAKAAGPSTPLSGDRSTGENLLSLGETALHAGSPLGLLGQAGARGLVERIPGGETSALETLTGGRITRETDFLGGLTTPDELVPFLAGLGPNGVTDEIAEAFLGVLARGGARVTKPLVKRFLQEVRPGVIRQAAGQGLEALGALFDDYVARAAEAVPGGREGPLGRLIGEEEGGLRLPGFGPRAARAVPTPGTPIANPADDADRALNDILSIQQGQRAAAQTPGGLAPIDPASPLATFDEGQRAGLLSKFRQLWTDENARLSDVQNTVEELLGKPLSPEQNALLKRKLYAGRQASSDQWVQDELQPIVQGLQPGQVEDVEAALELSDDAGRARAIQNRETAIAAGKEVGPVAGETALRNTNQSLRLRRARLGEALLKQDQADDAYRQALAEQRRVRTEGRREVRGSQGRGRRRVQRTPAEQAQVEADVDARLNDAKQATVDARAAAKDAARQANIDLSKTARADLKRMRLEGTTEALRMAEEAEIAEGAATKGAEAASQRRFSGGVTGAQYDDATIWEGVRRRVAQRLGPNASPQDVDAEFATVKQATEQLQGFSRQLRARLHDAGIISDDLYEQWERDFPGYIRTNILKYMDEEAATGAPAGAQRFSLSSLVGAGQDVGARMSTEGTHDLREQPINTLIRMTHGAETLARRNEVAQALERLVQADPSGELAKAFRPLKAGEQPQAGEVVFSVFKQGEPVRYAVDKRFEGLFNLAPEQANKVADMVGKLTLGPQFKAAVTTYNPLFVGVNAMRDYMVYLRRSSGKNPLEALRATGDLLGAYRDVGADALRRSRLGNLGQEARAPSARTADLREAIRLGGGQEAYHGGLTPQQVRQRLLLEPEVAKRATIVTGLGQVGAALEKAGGVIAKGADVGTKYSGVQALGRTIKGTGSVVETAPRLAAYRRALRQGKTPEEAALAMREITLDFSRGGTNARTLNKAIPFFNAAIQGSARFFGDDLVNRKGATAMQAGILLSAKLGLEAHNQTYGDDYADVPSYLKDNGLIYMLPGDVPRERRADGTEVPGQRNFLWFPLPQDMAAMLRVGSQVARRATGQTPNGFNTFQGNVEALGDVLGAASPVNFEGGLPLPPLARQVVEQTTNRDIFRGRDIVPDYLMKLPPEQQATDQTSALGRVVGGALGRVGGPSPARVDYGVTGMLGGTGRQLLNASDLAAQAVGRGDLASRPYSSPREQEALDAARRAPVLGPVVGGFARQSGGQLAEDAEARLNQRITDAQRAARDRLEKMPGYRRLPQSQKDRILQQELTKIRRELEEVGEGEAEVRQAQRLRTQRR